MNDVAYGRSLKSSLLSRYIDVNSAGIFALILDMEFAQ